MFNRLWIQTLQKVFFDFKSFVSYLAKLDEFSNPESGNLKCVVKFESGEESLMN